MARATSSSEQVVGRVVVCCPACDAELTAEVTARVITTQVEADHAVLIVRTGARVAAVYAHIEGHKAPEGAGE